MLYFSDGEVRIGIFGTTSKEAILSQLKPVIGSRRKPEPGSASPRERAQKNPPTH
jgi:hypothetical protein